MEPKEAVISMSPTEFLSLMSSLENSSVVSLGRARSLIDQAAGSNQKWDDENVPSSQRKFVFLIDKPIGFLYGVPFVVRDV